MSTAMSHNVIEILSGKQTSFGREYLNGNLVRSAKVCTSRLRNLMQILAALDSDVRFGKFVYRGFYESFTHRSL